MLRTLAISSYRSLRDLVIPLQRLTLITGPNGSGKSNLYRALRLLAETAQGRVIPSLAREGGLTSTLWAGSRSGPKRPISLSLGFADDAMRGWFASAGIELDRIERLGGGELTVILWRGIKGAASERERVAA